MAELYLNYYHKEESVSYQDKVVHDYIKLHPYGEDYSEIVEKDHRFFVFYHLSDFRSAALRWYPFKSGASILEIEAGMGALTGALCDRAGSVTVTENSAFRAGAIAERYRERDNLRIYAGELSEISCLGQYDYIIMFGQLEKAGNGKLDSGRYIQYLEGVSKYLKSDGKILIAVENRYGIQNLCGKKESHTGTPFDGIAAYPEGTSAIGFDRKQLQEVIEGSGLKKQKFYYPVPDYIAPQAIYTDAVQPDDSIQERLNTYYPEYDSLIADDHRVYLDAVRNGVFSFVSNSFLVEAGRSEECTDVDYVTLTPQRGRKKSFATIIMGNNKVLKRCMFPEGILYAAELCEDAKGLKNRGIPVIDMDLDEDALCMEYIDAPRLQQHINTLVQSNAPVEEVFRIFDRLWELIVQSSELSDRCAFTEDLDWGPVLKYAHIEMIPLNCFWREGKFFFYDQEFARGDYPAKYVMMRAIYYTRFISGMSDYLAEERLRERYGLSDRIWDICLAVEEAFQEEVNYRRIHGVQKNWQLMRSNRHFLRMPNAVWQAPKDENLIKKVHEVQINLLVELKNVCEKHGLTYFIMYGTLLGAVRHGGMIPWDDDIDVALPRDDYNRLLEVAEEEFKDVYFLQTPWNDNCFYGGYSKLRNTQTTAIEENNWWVHCCEGIGIDIFPLDYGYRNKWKAKWKEHKICFYQRLLYAKAYGYFARFMDMPLLIWKFYKYLGLPFSREMLADRLNREMEKGDIEDDAPMGIFAHYVKGRNLPKYRNKDFSGTVELEYDSMILPAPAGYHHILKKRYGRNYMDIPVRNAGELRHAFFSVNVPYTSYQKRFSGLFKPEPSPEREIILFGDGVVIEAYFKIYGKRYRPGRIVHVMGPCENRDFYGIPVEEFGQFQVSDIEKVYPVICTIYFRAVESKLRKAGYRDYYFFIPWRHWIRMEDPELALQDLEEEEEEDGEEI